MPILALDALQDPARAELMALAAPVAVRPRVEAALLRHAVMPLRQSIAATDRRMVEAGILSTLPRIVVDPSPRRAVEPRVPRTARASTTVVVAAPPETSRSKTSLTMFGVASAMRSPPAAPTMAV